MAGEGVKIRGNFQSPPPFNLIVTGARAECHSSSVAAVDLWHISDSESGSAHAGPSVLQAVIQSHHQPLHVGKNTCQRLA